jgi:hypothetical protein
MRPRLTSLLAESEDFLVDKALAPPRLDGSRSRPGRRLGNLRGSTPQIRALTPCPVNM